MSKKKTVEPICGNCRLFDPSKRECQVVILFEGEKVKLPVDPKDSCFFEQTYFDPTTKSMETLNEIQQIRLWVEDENGKPTDGNGSVKIEYPDSLEIC
jgi:hypothetical protein